MKMRFTILLGDSAQCRPLFSFRVAISIALTFIVVKGVNPSLELLSSSSMVLETTLEHSGLASLLTSAVLL